MSGGGGTGVNTNSSDFMNLFGGFFTLYKKSTPGSRGSGKAKKTQKNFYKNQIILMMKLKRKKQVYSTNMSRWLFAISISCYFVSCSPVREGQTVNTQGFSIKMPINAAVSKIPGNTPHTGILIWGNQAKDTLRYFFGYIVNSLTEQQPKVVFLEPQNRDTSIVDTKGFIISDDEFIDLDKYRKQTVEYILVDGRNAKVTRPREDVKSRLTGVYFDSLYTDSFARLRFSLYGDNLDKQRQIELIQAIKTISFNIDSLKKGRYFIE